MQCLQESEEKSHGERSPLMFESDEELIDNKENLTAENKQDQTKTVSCCNSNSTVLNEHRLLSKEEHLINRLQIILTGIPPPPAVTVPQIDSDDILKLWKANEHLIVEYKKCMLPGASEQEQAAAEKAARTKWPEVSHCQCMGVCFNKGLLSEELEYLSAKYKERYVGNETSSCVNSLYTKQTTLTASAKKRARHRGWGQSPGRRLSHLARRRKAFTSASFQSVTENSVKYPEKKMILIDVKKTGFCGAKGNSSKKRSLLGKSHTHKVNSSKRALFQSPDVNRNRNVFKHNKSLKYSPKNVRVQRSKRALWPSSSKTESEVNANGKRERVVTKTSPHKKSNRSLFVNEVSTLNSSHRKSPKKTCLEYTQATEKQICLKLSTSHRQKLLWAIANALREEGIRMSHEKFRPCASVLFKVCQKLWLERRQKMTNEGSTSENMLALARQFSSKVVYCVEKDLSNTNLAEVCSDLIKTAVAEQLVENKISSDKSVISKVINKQSIMYDNIKNYDSMSQCKLDSENFEGDKCKLNRTGSVECSVTEMQKATVHSQESSYKLCIKGGSKQNFVYIEDEETKFSVLKNDTNIQNYDSGLHTVEILKPNDSFRKTSFTVQPNANSFNCDNVNNLTKKAINLNSEEVPSCSRNNKNNDLNCSSSKTNIENTVMDSMPHTLTDTECVLSSNNRLNTFSNLIKENIASMHNIVNNIPVSEMLSWNADPISRLKSNTTLDVFAKDNLTAKVNLNVMSHWQNLVIRQETKQKPDIKSPSDNYNNTKLDNFCSLESTVDTDGSSSINSNIINNYDFSGIIDESKSWFLTDQHETYDVIQS